MNHVYRVVWSSSLGMFQVVSELTRSHGAKSSRAAKKRARRAFALKALAATAALAGAAPAALAIMPSVLVNGQIPSVGTSPTYSWDGTNLAIGGSIAGAVGVSVTGTNVVLGTLLNSGTINATLYGILNFGTIAVLSNGGGISAGTVGVANGGTVNESTPGLSSARIGTLTNSGTISGTEYGVENFGTIGVLNNAGSIGGGVTGVFNYAGSIGTLTNVGTITGGTADGVYNQSGTIDALVNHGTISGGTGGVYNAGVIGALSNDGLISGGSAGGVYNGGTIGTLSNSGLVTGTRAGIYNDDATIGTLSNVGLITGGSEGIYNDGTIGTLSNSGSISGGSNGIYNDGAIGTLSNSGSITSNSNGISNDGTIGTLSNSGSISGGTNGINNDGSIGALSNSGAITGHTNGIQNFGYIGTFSNSGSITHGEPGGSNWGGLYNRGTIGQASNSGVIDSVSNIGRIGIDDGGTLAAVGFANSGTIGELANSGDIMGSIAGVSNSGVIGTLFNANGWIDEVSNEAGVIGTLDNAAHIGILSNFGTIGVVFNVGTITNASQAILNNGTIGQLVNQGRIWAGTSAINIGANGSIGTLTNAGLIGGDIVNGSNHGLVINGAMFNFGTLTGSNGVGVISSPNADVTFASGNLVLDDNVEVGSHTVNNTGATLAPVDQVAITGNYNQSGGNVILSDNGGLTYNALSVSGNTTLTGGEFTLSAGEGLHPGASFTLVDTAGTASYGPGVAYSAGVYSTTITHTIVNGHDDLVVTLGAPLSFKVDSTVNADLTPNSATGWNWSGVNLSIASGAHALDNSTGAVIGSVTNQGTLTSLVNGVYSTSSSGSIIGSNTIGTIGFIGNEAGAVISSLTNAGLIGSIAGTLTVALGNAGTIGTITNSGAIMAANMGIINGGAVGTIDNSGTIYGAAVVGVANGLSNQSITSPTIGVLANSGFIGGFVAGVFNSGTIGTIVNSGTITGSTYFNAVGPTLAGIVNGGTIGTISNSGTIAGGFAGVNNGEVMGLGAGTVSIGVLNNEGVISGGYVGVMNGGQIDTLTNSGTIAGGYAGLFNGGTIGTFANSGTITGGSPFGAASTFNAAISNVAGSSLAAISNSGVIAGNIVNASTNDLEIDGGTGSTFGTLTGFGNTVGSIVNTGSNLNFGSGNLVLNDNVYVGTNTLTNAGATLQVNQAVTISGNYSQGAAATLLVGVSSGATSNGLVADTGYGRLVVTGDTNIDAGSNVSLKSNGYGFAAGQRYVVVDTAGAATYNAGSLKYSITGDAAASVSGAVVANGAKSDLVLTVNSVGSNSGGGSDGGGNSGGGNSGGGSGGSGGSPTTQANLATTPNAVSALRGLFAYTGIANAQLLNLYNAALSGVTGSTANANRIGQQLAPIQVARAVAAPTFDALNVVSAHVNALRVAQADGATGLATGDSFSQVNLWGQAFGGHASQDARDDVDGYSANYGGLLIGADKALNDKWRIGGVFQYAHTAINNSDNTSGDSTGVNGYGLIGYASFTGSPWYVNMSGAAVLQRYDTERRVTMPGFEGVANGGFNGQQYVASVEGGWPLAVGSATLTPLASLTYSYLNQNSYTETGGNGAALHVDSSSASSVRSALGAKIEKAYDTSYGQIVPELRAAWVHEYNRTRQSTGASFAGDPTGATGFTTVGMTPVSNLADISLGLTLLRANNLSVTARYELQAGSGFISNTGILRLQQRF